MKHSSQFFFNYWLEVALHNCKKKSARAAVNKAPQTGQLQQQSLCFHSFRGWKSKIKGSIRVLVRTLFLACRRPPSHYVLAHPLLCTCRKRDLWYLILFLEGHQSFCIRSPPLWPHLTLITSLKALSTDIVTLSVRASTYRWGRGQRAQFCP